MNKKFNIKEWKDTYLKEGSLDSDSVSTMLDIAARWSSTQDQAANQTWDDEQELYDYLKSDHIHKKYHKDFYKAVERAFTKNRVKEGSLTQESAKNIYLQDIASPLEGAMGKLNIESLDDITTIRQFNDLVKAMKKSGEAPAKFFKLRIEDQMKLVSQAQMYI